MADEPQLLKVEEVAEPLGLTRDTAYNLCYQRKLPCIRFRRTVRVRADVLAASRKIRQGFCRRSRRSRPTG